MTIDALIMLTGGFVAVLPFLGFPNSWDTAFLFLAGILIIVLGIVVRREINTDDSSTPHAGDTFVENVPAVSQPNLPAVSPPALSLISVSLSNGSNDPNPPAVSSSNLPEVSLSNPSEMPASPKRRRSERVARRIAHEET